MVSLLLTPRARTTSAMIAASALLFLAAPTAVADPAPNTLLPSTASFTDVAGLASLADLMPLLQQQGLSVQVDGGEIGRAHV